MRNEKAARLGSCVLGELNQRWVLTTRPRMAMLQPTVRSSVQAAQDKNMHISLIERLAREIRFLFLMGYYSIKTSKTRMRTFLYRPSPKRFGGQTFEKTSTQRGIFKGSTETHLLAAACLV